MDKPFYTDSEGYVMHRHSLSGVLYSPPSSSDKEAAWEAGYRPSGEVPPDAAKLARKLWPEAFND
jgi:hypothetical protein